MKGCQGGFFCMSRAGRVLYLVLNNKGEEGYYCDRCLDPGTSLPKYHGWAGTYIVAKVPA